MTAAEKVNLVKRAGFNCFAEIKAPIIFWNMALSQEEVVEKIRKEEEEMESFKEEKHFREEAIIEAEKYLKDAVKMKFLKNVTTVGYFSFPDIESCGFAIGAAFALKGERTVLFAESETVIKAISGSLKPLPISKLFSK